MAAGTDAMSAWLRLRDRIVWLLAAMFITGILGEVDTWADLRDPIADPIATARVTAYVLIPIGMIYATSRPAT